MDFTSTLFLFLFLPVFLLIYLTSAQRFRLPIILMASVIFLFAAGGTMALLWLGSILISGYLAGLAIARAKETGSHSLRWLWMAIGLNVAILSFFKFSTAFGSNGFGWLHLPPNWIPRIVG